MPIPFVHFQKRGVWFHCGMIDENVNATEIFFHLIDQVLRTNFFGDILKIGFRMSALCDDLIDNFLNIDR